MIRQCCERDGGWLLASRRISTMSNRGASRHDQTPPRASSCSADKHESQGRRSPHRSIDRSIDRSSPSGSSRACRLHCDLRSLELPSQTPATRIMPGRPSPPCPLTTTCVCVRQTARLNPMLPRGPLSCPWPPWEEEGSVLQRRSWVGRGGGVGRAPAPRRRGTSGPARPPSPRPLATLRLTRTRPCRWAQTQRPRPGPSASCTRRRRTRPCTRGWPGPWGPG